VRKLATWIIAASLWVSHALFAQDALVGTWQGDLAVAPGTKVRVQFIIDKKTDGSYAARLNAPKEPNLQNIPVNATRFEQGQLTLQVDAVSGAYKGSLQQGVLHGTWTQQGTSFPLDLAPYVKPVLSPEVMRGLVGSWHGKVRPRSMPNGLDLVMRFEMNAKNELVAYLDVPEQAVMGRAQQIDVTDDKKLSIRQPDLKTEFVANLQSNQLTGEFTQGKVGPLPLVLQRGEYKDQQSVQLSAEAKEKLRGAWNGQLRNAMTVVLRFADASDGSMQVTLDSLDQGAHGLPVRDIKLEGDQLSLAVPGIQAKLKGTLSARGIVGSYIQSGQTIPVTLTKGEYVAHKVQLPKDLTQRLLGKWEGVVGSTRLVFRFERDSHGEAFAFLDIPREKAADLPVTALRIDGGAMSFVVKAIPAEFKGQFAANEISGKWTTPNVQAPLMIKRSSGT
jgi:hypothetical protein